MYKSVILPLAKEDIRDASRWYDKVRLRSAMVYQIQNNVIELVAFFDNRSWGLMAI